MEQQLEFVFRQLFDPMPRSWRAGMYWQVEAHPEGEHSCPVGLCWVVDTSIILPPERKHEAYSPIVDFLFVLDSYRRAGVATALIDACRQRWPDLELTGTVSPEGEAFLKAYEERHQRRKEQPSR